jgi:ABC-2 type transport system permease protein
VSAGRGSLSRIASLLAKDLRLGPRSPLFLWAVVFPVVATLLVQLVFGTLLAPQPRLGVVDEGSSEVALAAGRLEGIEVRTVASADELQRLVRGHDLDAGLVLPAGFDDQVRAGHQPTLRLYVSGQSLASDRLILEVTTLDLVRQVESSPAPVEVHVVALGEEGLPVSARLVPLLVLFALLLAGVFVTAFSIVQEREGRTLDAMLVTPVRMGEILVAKGALGFVLSVLMALVTLWLNGALGSDPLALVVTLMAGALMFTQLGLVYATLARDAKTLYTLVKSLNLVLVAPVVFYLFPDWPQWLAQVFPTWWVIDPVFRVAVEGASLADVGWQVAVGLGISLALVPVVLMLGRRMRLALAGA